LCVALPCFLHAQERPYARDPKSLGHRLLVRLMVSFPRDYRQKSAVRLVLFLALISLYPWGAPIPAPAHDGIPVYTYEVVNAYPHDQSAFTQGLVFADGVLYEGTGRYGSSTLRMVELETGTVLKHHELPSHLFGEGITVFEHTIIQLTWQSRTGFVYDQGSFELLQQFSYLTEGWGITHDGNRLIMSDGTATLRFMDGKTFQILGHVDVHDGNGPVSGLNELEYVRGEVYANVWLTDRIAAINPQTGRVIKWIDLGGLLGPREPNPQECLNGIAYDDKKKRLFVTGKLWNKLFEIKPIPPE